MPGGLLNNIEIYIIKIYARWSFKSRNYGTTKYSSQW